MDSHLHASRSILGLNNFVAEGSQQIPNDLFCIFVLNRTLRKFLRWRRTRFGQKGGGFREARGANVAARRDFLLAAATTAGGGVMWRAERPRALAQEAPPETTRIRLARHPSLCVMPQYVVDELLAAEGRLSA